MNLLTNICILDLSTAKNIWKYKSPKAKFYNLQFKNLQKILEYFVFE